MHITVRNKKNDQEESGVIIGQHQRILVATKNGAFWIEETPEGLNVYVNGIDRLIVQPEGHSSITLRSR